MKSKFFFIFISFLIFQSRKALNTEDDLINVFKTMLDNTFENSLKLAYNLNDEDKQKNEIKKESDLRSSPFKYNLNHNTDLVLKKSRVKSTIDRDLNNININHSQEFHHLATPDLISKKYTQNSLLQIPVQNTTEEYPILNSMNFYDFDHPEEIPEEQNYDLNEDPGSFLSTALDYNPKANNIILDNETNSDFGDCDKNVIKPTVVHGLITHEKQDHIDHDHEIFTHQHHELSDPVHKNIFIQAHKITPKVPQGTLFLNGLDSKDIDDSKHSEKNDDSNIDVEIEHLTDNPKFLDNMIVNVVDMLKNIKDNKKPTDSPMNNSNEVKVNDISGIFKNITLNQNEPTYSSPEVKIEDHSNEEDNNKNNLPDQNNPHHDLKYIPDEHPLKTISKIHDLIETLPPKFKDSVHFPLKKPSEKDSSSEEHEFSHPNVVNENYFEETQSDHSDEHVNDQKSDVPQKNIKVTLNDSNDSSNEEIPDNNNRIRKPFEKGGDKDDESKQPKIFHIQNVNNYFTNPNLKQIPSSNTNQISDIPFEPNRDVEGLEDLVKKLLKKKPSFEEEFKMIYDNLKYKINDPANDGKPIFINDDTYPDDTIKQKLFRYGDLFPEAHDVPETVNNQKGYKFSPENYYGPIKLPEPVFATKPSDEEDENGDESQRNQGKNTKPTGEEDDQKYVEYPLDEPVTAVENHLDEPVTAVQYPLDEPVTAVENHLDEPVTAVQYPLDEPVTAVENHLDEPVTAVENHLDEPVTAVENHLDEPVTAVENHLDEPVTAVKIPSNEGEDDEENGDESQRNQGKNTKPSNEEEDNHNKPSHEEDDHGKKPSHEDKPSHEGDDDGEENPDESQRNQKNQEKPSHEEDDNNDKPSNEEDDKNNKPSHEDNPSHEQNNNHINLDEPVTKVKEDDSQEEDKSNEENIDPNKKTKEEEDSLEGDIQQPTPKKKTENDDLEPVEEDELDINNTNIKNVDININNEENNNITVPVNSEGVDHKIFIHVHHHEKKSNEEAQKEDEKVAEEDCSQEDEEQKADLDKILKMPDGEREMIEIEKSFNFI
jgi:hypothetical protein